MKKAKPQNTALLILVLACTLTNSCALKQERIQNSAIEETNPKLLFLNYKISENLKGKKHITFINKIITDGKLKKSMHINNGDSGDLICNQLDKNSNILQSITIKNPLIKTFEYVDDSKQFQRKKVELKEVEFSLKLKFEPTAEYLVIKEIKSTSIETKLLIKTKIN